MGLWKKLLATAATLPFIAACGEGPAVVSNFIKNESLLESSLVHAGKSGPIFAPVLGNPFGMDPMAFGDRIRVRMTSAWGHRVFSYTGNREEAAQPEISVMILFGAPLNTNGRALCEGRIPTLAVNPDKIRVRGVVCSHGELLADAEGWVRGVTSIEDRRFESLISTLMIRLFSG